jgi:hypothetical protein
MFSPTPCQGGRLRRPGGSPPPARRRVCTCSIRSDLRGLCAVHLPRARVTHDALHRPPGPHVVPPSQPPLTRRQRRFAPLLGTPPSGSSFPSLSPDGSLCLHCTTLHPLRCCRPYAVRRFSRLRLLSRVDSGRTLVRASLRVVPPPGSVTMGLVTSLRSVATASLFPWYPSTAAVASTAPSADSAMTAFSHGIRRQRPRRPRQP